MTRALGTSKYVCFLLFSRREELGIEAQEHAINCPRPGCSKQQGRDLNPDLLCQSLTLFSLETWYYLRGVGSGIEPRVLMLGFSNEFGIGALGHPHWEWAAKRLNQPTQRLCFLLTSYISVLCWPLLYSVDPGSLETRVGAGRNGLSTILGFWLVCLSGQIMGWTGCKSALLQLLSLWLIIQMQCQICHNKAEKKKELKAMFSLKNYSWGSGDLFVFNMDFHN